MDDAELRRLAEELAERVATDILKLENVTLQEGGCEHTSDDDDGTCWHCREERYERVVLSAAPTLLRRVSDEATRQERERMRAEVVELMGGGRNMIVSGDYLLDWLDGRIKEGDYVTKARPDCSECKGTGFIGYRFEVDTTRIAPCHRCFPEDKFGREMAERWASR